MFPLLICTLPLTRCLVPTRIPILFLTRGSAVTVRFALRANFKVLQMAHNVARFVVAIVTPDQRFSANRVEFVETLYCPADTTRSAANTTHRSRHPEGRSDPPCYQGAALVANKSFEFAQMLLMGIKYMRTYLRVSQDVVIYFLISFYRSTQTPCQHLPPLRTRTSIISCNVIEQSQLSPCCLLDVLDATTHKSHTNPTQKLSFLFCNTNE
jgi:hypothetical protein